MEDTKGLLTFVLNISKLAIKVQRILQHLFKAHLKNKFLKRNKLLFKNKCRKRNRHQKKNRKVEM